MPEPIRRLHPIKRWLVPHHANHHRPHLIRPVGLLAVAVMVAALQLHPGNIVTHAPGQVLSYASDITPVELIKDTNAERVKVGLAPLRLDARLNASAEAKGENMFEENYWAHVSPSGIQPWHWFEQQHYQYAYAGENLAKDFDTSDGVTQGWMNSPSHRENLLNPHYVDVGFAVINGTLQGHETTLVVAHYGTLVPSTVVAAAHPSAPSVSQPAVPSSPTPSSVTVATPSVLPSSAPPAIAPIKQSAPSAASYSLVRPLPVSYTLDSSGKASLVLLMLILAIMLWSHSAVWRKKLIHGYTHKYRLRIAAELAIVGTSAIIIIVRSFGAVS